jgi:hypothetical protein
VGRGGEDDPYAGLGPARERLPEEQADFPETCEWCNVLVTDGSELYGLVPDSSVIHASDPSMDGSRLITACSDEHLVALRVRYAARPFVNEEQWARSGLVGSSTSFPYASACSSVKNSTGTRRTVVAPRD